MLPHTQQTVPSNTVTQECSNGAAPPEVHKADVVVNWRKALLRR